MNRADFVFTIGYQGNTAIVDKNARNSFGRATTKQLLDAGFYKPAFCSAVYAGSTAEMESFLEAYRQATGQLNVTEESLKRLYGVFTAPDHIQKVLLI